MTFSRVLTFLKIRIDLNYMNPKTQTAMQVARNLIFIPVCASCGERLSPIPERKEGPTRGKICFCRKCMGKWIAARAEICPVCANTSDKCNCTPDYFFNHQPEIPSLCFYRPESGNAGSKAIIIMKRRVHFELFDFMAEELSDRLSLTLAKMKLDAKDCIFTWVPRKRRAVNEHGFDQAKELTKRMARLMGAQAYPLLTRSGGKEQKRLDKTNRKSNAEKSIHLRENIGKLKRRFGDSSVKSFVKGKTVIIIDDVMTSGATLKRSCELLLAAKAENTIVACIAKSVNVKAASKNSKS